MGMAAWAYIGRSSDQYRFTHLVGHATTDLGGYFSEGDFALCR